MRTCSKLEKEDEVCGSGKEDESSDSKQRCLAHANESLGLLVSLTATSHIHHAVCRCTRSKHLQRHIPIVEARPQSRIYTLPLTQPS